MILETGFFLLFLTDFIFVVTSFKQEIALINIYFPDVRFVDRCIYFFSIGSSKSCQRHSFCVLELVDLLKTKLF